MHGKQSSWVAVVSCALALAPPAAAAAPPDAALKRAAKRVVAAGIPGVAALVTARGGTTFVSAGRADVRRPRPPRPRDRYRLASMSKAFSGAVVMSLAAAGRLGLDDTVERWLPGLLPYGAQVTIRQLLGHTGGVPSYTETTAFAEAVGKRPRAFLSPGDLIGFIAGLPLDFPPGSAYRYSNTDNVLLGLIAARAGGRPYAALLRGRVFGPLGLRSAFLASGVRIPGRHVRGYLLPDRGRPEDATAALSPSGAWASGGIVADIVDVGRFFRALLAGRAYPAALLREARRTRPGASEPPGPGRNFAGLALFRYRLGCGTVWGHTGLFPGYRNFAVASADGRRSAVVMVNGTGPGAERAERAILALQRRAACAALGR